MPANGLGHFDIKSTLISWALTFAQGSIFQVQWNQSLLVAWTSQPRNPPRSKNSKASAVSKGRRGRGPTHPSQVFFQASDFRDPAVVLLLLHEFRHQVPSERLESLRMQEKEVRRVTPDSLRTPDQPDQETGRGTNQGENAGRH